MRRMLWLTAFLLCLAACEEKKQEVVIPTQRSLPTSQPSATPLVLTATPTLAPVEIFSGNLAGEPQQWYFAAEAGDSIRLEVVRLTEELNLQAQLLAPDGALISQFGVSEASLSAPVMLPTAGIYTLQISGGGTSGGYSIRIFGSPIQRVAQAPPSPTPLETATLPPTATLEIIILPSPSPTATPQNSSGRLTVGETQQGAITQSGETQRYTFFANAGDTLSVVVNPDPRDAGTLDPFLQLQAPNGEIVAQNDNMLAGVRDALVRDFRVPATGVYTVYVKSSDERGTGSYLISLSDSFTLRDVPRGEAAYGVPNDQRLETYGARDVWTIDLKAGDVISIAVQVVDPDSAFDVMTELVAPDGQVWFDDDSGGGADAYLNAVEAPLDGTYRLHVAAQNNASIGEYRLWWQRVDDLPSP